MTNVVVGTAEELGPIYKQMTEYRYSVFVNRLGWKLPCEGESETDQFDRTDTIYLAVAEQAGVLGCARLLPTTSPYLLGEVFPELLHGQPIPSTPEVWELSRFSTMPAGGDRVAPQHQLDGGFLPLLEVALKTARSRGARRLITVSPVGIERMVRRKGIRAYRAAPPVDYDGELICALWMDIDQ